MQLRITDYHGVSRRRWELQDDADNFLGDHEVNLDADTQEYKGYDDPPEYLRTYRAARTGDEELHLPLVEHGIRFFHQRPKAPANRARKHTAPVLFGPRPVATGLITPDQPPEFALQYTGMFRFPRPHGDQPRRCGRWAAGRAPRPPADVGALRRATGARTSRGVAGQGRHVIDGGYNHDLEVRA